MTAALHRLLFVPDTHVPYEDGRAFAVMLAAARRFRPHHVVLLGDFADMFAVSAHDKNPNRGQLLEAEIEAVNRRLDEIESIGAREITYIFGNHEWRLERYLVQRASALFNVVRLPALLRLRERGWKHVPYMQDARIGKLCVTHDVGSAGVTAHTRARADYAGNCVIGHTHRMAIDYRGNVKGSAHVGAMFGWLGDRHAADYLHTAKAAAWMLGFGLGWMEPGGTVHLQAVPIIDYRCVVNGEVITCSPRGARSGSG